MLSLSFNHVRIESYVLDLPKKVVTSLEIEERLKPLYEKLNVPLGTLEKLSGIHERHMFEESDTPSKVATEAGRKAIEKIGFDKSYLKALFNCSVTRDYFEPATAVLAHYNLGFPEDTITMDITNACIGFSHGMVLMANLIESGVIKAGLLVSGENIAKIIEATYRTLENTPDIDRTEFLKLMTTFTLGSGAIAMVLAHDSIATSSHKLLACSSRAASNCHPYCVGNGDFCYNQMVGLNPIMHTDSHPLVMNAATLGARTWADLSEFTGWKAEDVDHVFCHQIGKVVNQKFYETMGLPFEKEYAVYQNYGNLISASMPAAWFTAADKGLIEAGSKNVMTAFGSGLNALFSAVEW